jgi:hypothetical protein
VAYLRLLGDESEVENVRHDLVDPLERDVRATADALLEGRQEPPLQLLIQGLNLGEAKDRIESEIRRIVVEELVEDALARSRGAQPESEELPPPDEGGAISVSLGGLSMPRSLGGLDLSPADARRVEARVQQKVQPIVAPFIPPNDGGGAAGAELGEVSDPVVASHGGPSNCICVHNTPTTRFLIAAPDSSSGPTTNLGVLDPFIPPPPTPYRILIIPVIPDWSPSDRISMTVSRSLVLPSDRMLVSLASSTAWAKAIEAWNFCEGRQAEVFQGGTSTVPNEMTIFCCCGPGHAHTLNFNKPGFLGIWRTVLRPWDRDFWAMLRGRRVDFVWLRD